MGAITMKPREHFRVVFLLSNGHYHPNEVPMLVFPLGPARLATRLRKAGYPVHILDTQAEGLLQVVLREQTRRLGPFVGRSPELMLQQHEGFTTVETGLPDHQLLERLKSLKPDLILATLNFSIQTSILNRQIRRIRAEIPAPIIVGGVAASMYPESLGEHRSLVYRGKFDDYIVDLVDAYRTGEGMGRFERYKTQLAPLTHSAGTIDVEGMDPSIFPSYRIPAILYEEANRVFKDRIAKKGLDQIQKQYPYVVSDNGNLYLEGPIYGILTFNRFSRDAADGLTAHVMTREGCIFTCEGCHVAVETRLGVPLGIQTRKIDLVVQELKDLRRAGYRKIMLGDDQALLPKSYLPMLARAISGMGLEFFLPNAVLVNAIAKLEQQTLCDLVKGGFRSYSLAVESASQQIVDLYWDKKIPSVLKTTIEACEKLRAASSEVGLPIRTEIYFVIGNAGVDTTRETLDQMYDSICFARYLIERHLASYNVFSLFIPAPGTVSYENLNREGKIVNEEAMSFGIYAIDGKDLYSPRSLEALRLAGWLFANRKEVTNDRSGYNLEPNVAVDPHAHIDKSYRDRHLKALEMRYESFVTNLKF